MEQIYEMTLEDVILRKKEIVRAEKRKRKGEREELWQTSITLPQLVRITINNIKEQQSDLNWQDLGRIIIEHGFSIMEYKYNKVVKEIAVLRKGLALPQVRRLRNFMIDTKVNVDGTEKPATKTVVIRRRLQAGINTMAERLGIEMSSMIRLCIYHSFAVGDESIISKEMIEESKSQLKKFKYDLIEAKVVLMGFEYSEDLWREKKNDWLDELNNIDKVDFELELEDE